jgi:hypothetical protein
MLTAKNLREEAIFCGRNDDLFKETDENSPWMRPRSILTTSMSDLADPKTENMVGLGTTEKQLPTLWENSVLRYHCGLRSPTRNDQSGPCE